MEVTYLQAIHDAMQEEMRRDASVFLLGEDIGAYGGAFQVTKGLHEEFGGRRVVDTPISEEAIVGLAVGAALVGMRPVAEMQFADFISCGFDQIVNMAATMRYRYGGDVGAPLVIRAPCGGGVHGGLFHSQMPEAWFYNVPGLKVVLPATAYDAKGLLKAAIRDADPVVYLEHKYLYRRIKEELPQDDFVVPIGKAELRREGTALTIVTYSAMVHQALAAAERLAEEGVSAEVVDLRTVRPLDKGTLLASFKRTNKALILYEASKAGGVGAEISAIIAEEAFEYLDGPLVRLACPESPAPFSPPLEKFYLPNVDDIVAAAEKLNAY
ncbi:MAG: alpha-ketoacid dehydrogenase subunit beta [Armatimonadota bacterium]|jgi:2-oxoisovalerate dehydrogenase E1 component beta subunit